MKTVLFIISITAFFAYGCNKSSVMDTDKEVQREESYERDGNEEKYKVEETRDVHSEDNIQKQDERSKTEREVELIDE